MFLICVSERCVDRGVWCLAPFDNRHVGAARGGGGEMSDS